MSNDKFAVQANVTTYGKQVQSAMSLAPQSRAGKTSVGDNYRPASEQDLKIKFGFNQSGHFSSQLSSDAHSQLRITGTRGVSQLSNPPESLEKVPSSIKGTAKRIDLPNQQSQKLESESGDFIFKKKDWRLHDVKKIDMFAVKLQAEGGYNMYSWNKVVPTRQLMPNIDLQREAFRKYKKL